MLALCLPLAISLCGCVRGDQPSIEPPTNTLAATSTAPTPAPSTSETPSPSTDAPRGDGIAIPAPGSIPSGTVTRSEDRPSYTFREEWRRAIPVAWKQWDDAAYLVQAFGSYMNDEGVPSEWTMHFRTPANSDIGTLKIDSWGTVTEWRVMPDRSPNAGSAARAVPPSIIDSDEAVAIGTARLAKYPRTSLTDPQLQLLWAESGTGIRWYYVVYHAKSSSFISVEIDAQSSKVVGLRKYAEGEMNP